MFLKPWAHFALAALAAAAASEALGQVARMNYGQYLVETLRSRHRDILLIGLHVTPPGESDNIIIASNFGRLGKKADDDDLFVISSGVAKAEANKAGTRYAVELPMRNVDGATIGALGLNFALRPGQDKAALERRAELIRDELARRSADAGNLLDPFPFEASTTTLTHAQKLLDAWLAKHPQVLIASLRVPRAGGAALAASNIGRHGQAADANDVKVLFTQRSSLIADAAGRVHFKFVLRDGKGAPAALLDLVLPSGDAAAAQDRATALSEDFETLMVSAPELLQLDP